MFLDSMSVCKYHFLSDLIGFERATATARETRQEHPRLAPFQTALRRHAPDGAAAGIRWSDHLNGQVYMGFIEDFQDTMVVLGVGMVLHLSWNLDEHRGSHTSFDPGTIEHRNKTHWSRR